MELTQTPGWQSKIFRSIDPWPFNTSLWEQWEQIYTGKGDAAHFCAASKEKGTGSFCAQHPKDLQAKGACPPFPPTSENNKTEDSPSQPLSPEPQQLTTPSDPRLEARLFYKKHKKEMDAGATVLWPQVEDLYTLMCLRAESGCAAFEREKTKLPPQP